MAKVVAPTLPSVIIQVSPSDSTGFSVNTWLSAVPTVGATLVAVLAVHLLTRRRDREKYVFELYGKINDQCEKAAEAAIAGWTSPKKIDRTAGIAETKWRVHQLGMSLERLKTLSSRRKWSFTWRLYFREDVSIVLREEVTQLRKAWTDDPFENPERRADVSKRQLIESEKGAFLSALDSKLHSWMS